MGSEFFCQRGERLPLCCAFLFLTCCNLQRLARGVRSLLVEVVAPVFARLREQRLVQLGGVLHRGAERLLLAAHLLEAARQEVQLLLLALLELGGLEGRVAADAPPQPLLGRLVLREGPRVPQLLERVDPELLVQSFAAVRVRPEHTLTVRFEIRVAAVLCLRLPDCCRCALTF